MLRFAWTLIFGLAVYVWGENLPYAILWAIMPFFVTDILSYMIAFLSGTSLKETREYYAHMWWLLPLYGSILFWHEYIHPVMLFTIFSLFIFGPLLWIINSNRIIDSDRYNIAILFLSAVMGSFLIQTCVYHDALWTYGYSRSVVFDFDVDFFNEFYLHNGHFMYVPPPELPVFYSGLALFFVPFFYLGKLITLGLSHFGEVYPYDGYAPPFRTTLQIGMAVLNTSGYVVLYRICRLFYKPVVSIWAVLFLFWCGNGLFFVYTWPLYAHGMDVFVTSIFYLMCLKEYVSGKKIPMPLLGVAFGIMIWIRPQNVLHSIMLLPMLTQSLKGSRIGFMKKWGVFSACCGLFIIPQVILWYKNSGSFYTDVYQLIGDEFFWFKPDLWKLLFAPAKGLFVWNPLFLCVPVGFACFYRYFKSKALLMLGVSVAQVYLVAVYEFPDGGAGFGCRYLQCLYPVFAVCIAALLETCVRHIRFYSMALYFLACFNIALIIGYHLEKIPHNPTTLEYQDVWIQAPWKGMHSLKEFFISTHINENLWARTWYWVEGSADALRLLYVIIVSSLVVLFSMLMFKLISRVSVLEICSRKWQITVILAGLLLNGTLLLLPQREKNHQFLSILKKAYPSMEMKEISREREFWLNQNSQHIRFDLPDNTVANKIYIISSVFDDHRQLNASVPLVAVTIFYENQSETRLLLRHEIHTGLYHSTAAYESFNATKLKVINYWMDKRPQGGFFYGKNYLSEFNFNPRKGSSIKHLSFELVSSADINVLITGVYLKCET